MNGSAQSLVAHVMQDFAMFAQLSHRHGAKLTTPDPTKSAQNAPVHPANPGYR